MDGRVKLFDLLIIESIAVLLRVYLGMVQDLITETAVSFLGSSKRQHT
jgi:hypothetical protein